MPNQLSMQPSSQDRALAKEVGFDEKALAIVKEITGSEFRKVELNNYEFEPDWSKYHVNHRPKVTAAEVESFRKMGDKYPELKTTIEKWIANFKKPATINPQWTAADQARWLEIQEKTKQFRPYIQQENDGLRKDMGLKANQFVTFPDQQQKNRTPDEIAKEMAAKYANKPLAEKYEPFSALEFNIPIAGHDARQMPKIVPMSQSMGMFFFAQDAMKTITQLQNKLKDLGYTVVAKAPKQSEDIFDDKDAAIAFANSRPRAPLEQVDILEIKSLTSEQEIDPTQLGDQSSMLFSPNRHFEKIGPNKWRFTSKPMYSVKSILLRAVLLKSDSPSSSQNAESSKFAIVRATNTDGANYDVSNDMIVAKLRDWDKEYGVNIIEAKSDTLVIEFESLPDDLSYLCTEMWLLCPDLLDVHDDCLLTASAMRDFAVRLRQNRQVTLWWD